MRDYLDIRQTTTRILRAPVYGSFVTMHELVKLAKDSGSHWFDADTLRFFRSKVYAGVQAGSDGWYFISSERVPGEPRKYSIRRLSYDTNEAGSFVDVTIDTIGEFCQYPTMRAARRALAALAVKEPTPHA